MGNKDAAVFRHLRQIMVDYEEDYENKQENMWKKEFFKYCKCIDETTNELTAQINEYAYSSLGQLAAPCVLTGSVYTLAYVVVLMPVSIFTGFLTGTVLQALQGFLDDRKGGK